MAFENYPEKENAQIASTSVSEKKENKSLKGILIGLLVAALLGTWAYVIYDKNKIKETVVQKETVIASTSGQRDQPVFRNIFNYMLFQRLILKGINVF